MIGPPGHRGKAVPVLRRAGILPAHRVGCAMHTIFFEACQSSVYLSLSAGLEGSVPRPPAFAALGQWHDRGSTRNRSSLRRDAPVPQAVRSVPVKAYHITGMSSQTQSIAFGVPILPMNHGRDAHATETLDGVTTNGCRRAVLPCYWPKARNARGPGTASPVLGSLPRDYCFSARAHPGTIVPRRKHN
jgi:hypothetical protein